MTAIVFRMSNIARQHEPYCKRQFATFAGGFRISKYILKKICAYGATGQESGSVKLFLCVRLVLLRRQRPDHHTDTLGPDRDGFLSDRAVYRES